MLAVYPKLSHSQYYNLGQDPASIRWRQIKTPHIKYIYPAPFETKAIKLASALEPIVGNETNTLLYKPKRVSFVLHNYVTESNGVTVWTPKRVELFTCPPQDIYAEDWLEQLVKHEYRHVVQIDRNNQGFTKLLSWFIGQQAAAMVVGAYIPSWFMEGDAVCTETAFSQSGRGRIPNFEMPIRAQVIEKGAFSFDKAVLGSYKSFVPDQYALGYPMVANVRRKYGYQAWAKTLNEVARKPFMLTPFNHGLKKATGLGKVALYKQTMQYLDSLWKYQQAKTELSLFTQLVTAKKSEFENYKFPHYLNDSLVISEYSSLDYITSFVLTGPNGLRHKLVTAGFLSSEAFSVVKLPLENSNTVTPFPNNFKLAWTETINDIRWEQRSYSVILIYDGRSGSTRTLTHKSRYFSPSFSPDGSSLASIKVEPSNHCSIVLLDTKTGKETTELISSDSLFFMSPSWSEDGKQVVFCSLDKQGKSVKVIIIESKTVRTLVPSTFIEISNPVFAGNYILFNGNWSGIENIYAIDPSNNSISQVTSAQFGGSNARLSPNGNKIVYSNYSSSGYGLAETSLFPTKWKSTNEIDDYSPSLYKYLVKEEKQLEDTSIKSNSYTSKPYNKAAHILNFHSWAPYYLNYMAGENGLGISFMSQNELSTATTIIGYHYDAAENTGKVTADINWAAWYPILDFNTSYGARTAYTDSLVRYNFNETVLSGGLTLPLLFTGGKYYERLQLGAHTTWTDITSSTSPEKNRLSGTIHTIDYSLIASRYIKQSSKDIYPRWGQWVSATYRHSPFGKYNLGSIFSVSSHFYFPGFLNHHGFRLDVNWQEKKYGEYTYSNQIALPRGYLVSRDKALTVFALNYKFPLNYPDCSIGSLAYIKRVKIALFYDGGFGETYGKRREMRSTGTEITSDVHLLRFVFPFDLGIRMGYLPLENGFFSDVLLSINLSK